MSFFNLMFEPFLFFFVFFFGWTAWLSGSQPGIEPGPSAVKAQSPNHWAAREFPEHSWYNVTYKLGGVFFFTFCLWRTCLIKLNLSSAICSFSPVLRKQNYFFLITRIMTYNIIPEHIRFLEISCNVWNIYINIFPYK